VDPAARAAIIIQELVLLPSLDEFGYLPPGIHRCGAVELAARFGSGSIEREIETQELLDFMIGLAERVSIA
jgi:hypothetical protein